MSTPDWSVKMMTVLCQGAGLAAHLLNTAVGIFQLFSQLPLFKVSLSLSLSVSLSLSLSLSLTHTHTHTHTMCVLGPTSHFSNLGLSDSCLFVLLTFSLAFVAMDVSPTLRARALSLNLTPSIHAPLLASFWD